VAISHERGSAHVIVEHDGTRLTLTADAVVSTLPLHALSRIDIGQSAHPALTRLAAVPYPPVSSLALGFRRADVGHALDGFGVLVPSAERKRILGVLFSSTLFEHRAPDDVVLLTCFLGGVRQPDVGRMETAALLDVVLPELASILGVTGTPTFVQHTVWPNAIPQYNVGHDDVSHAADAVEAAMPGLIVDGQFRRGVSVGDCIAAGALIASRVTDLARGAIAMRADVPDGQSATRTPPAPAAVA
jgi:oxygen-dependent protoporphyrinogen oxidase